jgi:hypothetical protein
MRRFAAQGKPSDGPRGPGPAGEATDDRDLVPRPLGASRMSGSRSIMGAPDRHRADRQRPRVLRHRAPPFAGTHEDPPCAQRRPSRTMAFRNHQELTHAGGERELGGAPGLGEVLVEGAPVE